PGEDCGIAEFLASVDAIVMGRNTFLQVLSFTRDGKPWMYGEIPLYVVSCSLERLPEGSPESVKLLRTRDVTEVVRILRENGNGEGLKKRGGTSRRIYVDGGELVRSFIAASLLNEITVTMIPKLIGVGRRIFGGAQDVELALKECKTWEFGFV